MKRVVHLHAAFVFWVGRVGWVPTHLLCFQPKVVGHTHGSMGSIYEMEDYEVNFLTMAVGLLVVRLDAPSFIFYRENGVHTLFFPEAVYRPGCYCGHISPPKGICTVLWTSSTRRHAPTYPPSPNGGRGGALVSAFKAFAGTVVGPVPPCRRLQV